MSDKLKDTQENGNQPTLESQINTALQNVDEKGKVIFEDNVDPVFKAAVNATASARFFQVDQTKLKQENVKLQAEHDVLVNKATSGGSLSTEQTAELETLKYTDTDAWFALKTKYEAEAKATVSGQLQEQLGEASTKALQDLTLVQRTEALTEFAASTGLELTDDVMQNDIPPRLQAKIGTMPFNDYLKEVATYLGKNKVVKQTDEGLKQTDLEKLAGGSLNEIAKPTKHVIL